MAQILIIPIGQIDRDILDRIAHALGEISDWVGVVPGKSLSVPQETYHARRGQYHSTKILQILAKLRPDRQTILVGVIDEDLFVPELNFVFGEADPATGVAIIALPRLRQEFYGLNPDRALFLLRAAKEAIHELGHVCGLDHCPNPRRIMHFSNSLRDTDLKEVRFCGACRKKRGL